MTGPEHYAAGQRDHQRGDNVFESHPDMACAYYQSAQAHFTAATAAATALGKYTESGLPERDRKAWYEVAGTKPAPLEEVA